MSAVLMAAIAIAQTTPTVPVFEKPVIGEFNVAFQAVVTYEPRGREDAANWEILGRTLLAGTQDYSGSEIQLYGSQAGFRPRVLVMPGYMRVEMVAPPRFADEVAKIMTQVLISPNLNDLQVNRAKESAFEVPTDAFLGSLRMQEPDFEKVTHETVQVLWARTFQPSNMKIYVGGNVEVGEVPEIVRQQCREWRPEKPSLRFTPQLPVDLPTDLTGTGSYELRGEVLKPNSLFSSARFLAVVALGVGKDCSMHRVLREEKGWSYRNEGILYPTKEGWVPRLVMLRDGPEGVELLEQMRQALIKDVDSWNEQTLARAIVLGRESLNGKMPWSPVWVDDQRPMTDSLVDQLALFGYLDMVESADVSIGTWVKTLENVDLEVLKEQAKEMLTKASGVYLPKS